MKHLILAVLALAVVAPTVLALPATTFPMDSPKPLLLLDLKIYEPQTNKVLVRPRILTLNEHEAELRVFNDRNEREVRLRLQPILRTPNLISVRIKKDDDENGMIVCVKPGEKITIVLPDGQGRCLDMTARLLPGPIPSLSEMD